MPFMWNIEPEDYEEIIKRALAKGIKPGESMEKVFLEYMKEKGQKPIGATDLNMEELLTDLKSKGKNAISIEHGEDGEEIIKFIKKKDEEND